MNIKIPTAVAHKFGRQILHVQKASPQLMFAAGVASVIGAGVLACRSTLKLDETIAKGEIMTERANRLLAGELTTADGSEYTEQLHKRNLTVIKIRTGLDVVKLYSPAIGLGVLGIGLLTGSHVVLNRRNASVTAAYAAASEAFDKYRERVRTELGEDQDRNFRYGTRIDQELVTKKDGSTKTVDHVRFDENCEVSQYARFFDETCENWKDEPEYNRIFLQAQQNYMNHLLQARGHVFLNDVYDALGFERSGAGAVVGWFYNNDRGGDNHIDFGIFDDKTGTGAVRDFVNGREGSILLDFNVDGIINDLLRRRT